MKETEKKLDILLAKAGQFNNYQFLVTFLFLIQLTCAEFFNQSLPFLEKGPYVFVNNTKESVLINYKICRSETIQYIVDENKLPNSIIVDFEIYCKESKIFYLGLMVYLGMIIGSCTSYLFADKIGRKKTLIIFIPIHILFLCTFKILKPSLGSYCLYLVYLNVFLLGICSHIIIVTMIIYICDIIRQTDIPIFVILIITGVPISSLLGTLLFNIKNLDWRDSLLIIAGINFIFYLFTIFKIIGSPIFSLTNEFFETFIFDLIELGKRNGVILTLDDFEFLNPYMTIENRRTIYMKFMKGINELNSSLINKNQISNSEENLKPVIEEENLEILTKKTLKEDYLLSNYENNEELLKLFGKLKMKDYSPFDLLRFQKQIKNFLILSFLWGVTMLIKTGINLQSKFIQKMDEQIYLPVFNYVLEIIIYYVMLSLNLKPKIEFHNPLILFQIISFIIFMIILYLDLDAYNEVEIILLHLGRLCWACMFTLLFVITSIIYPIMIRTKGLGWNISFGFIGSIASNVFIEYIDFKNFIYIFLSFDFFTLMLSFGLPNKIGTFILESPSHENNKKKEKNKDKENNELIEIRNTIVVKDKDNSDNLERSNSLIIDNIE